MKRKKNISLLSQAVTKAERNAEIATAELIQRVKDANAQVGNLKAKVAEAEEAIKRIRSAKATVEVAVSDFLNLSADRLAAIEKQTTIETPTERTSVGRARLFVNGTKLGYAFVDEASVEVKKVVADAVSEWEKYANLDFRLVGDPKDAEIRIGLKQGDGSWSFVGTDTLNIPIYSPTMNFGWDITDSRQSDTVISEFGHVLGFPNENQNPRDGIIWNEEAVYKYFSQVPNRWSRESTEHNILRKLQIDDYPCSRSYDPNSIMMNSFPSGLTADGAAITPKPGLSESDKALADGVDGSYCWHRNVPKCGCH